MRAAQGQEGCNAQDHSNKPTRMSTPSGSAQSVSAQIDLARRNCLASGSEEQLGDRSKAPIAMATDGPAEQEVRVLDGPAGVR